MPYVVYNFVPLCCVGSLEGCRAASEQIYSEVMALQCDPPCIGCSTRLMPDRATAENQIIDHDLFRRLTGDVFPYLWVQVRYDPAVRSDAALAPLVERFRLAVVNRFEVRSRFVM
jgi:hypothetical protein